MKRAVCTAALAAFLLPALASAFGAAGAASSPYLKLPMGARGTGMGEAFSGIANDVNALYYNPAGLTAMDAAQLQLMHLEGFGGVRYENLGKGMRVGNAYIFSADEAEGMKPTAPRGRPRKHAD